MNLQKCAGKETTFDPNFKCSIERLKHLISSNKFSTLTQTKPGQRVLEIACFSCLTQNKVQKIQPTVYKESCINFFSAFNANISQQRINFHTWNGTVLGRETSARSQKLPTLPDLVYTRVSAQPLHGRV